ncbi:MAG: shikimate dehydrogenase [Solirubrobacterales bacterium]|nr:shikimate dehydrogenase [Solirubrobacterales bacterium]
MQSAALEALGLAPEWSYSAVEVEPEGFEARVRDLSMDGYAGVNVTVPHKHAALAMADEASEAARQIGAANTLSFCADRTVADADAVRPWVVADNTDAGGLLAALPSTPLDAHTLVLGAGGAARAVVWALVGEGARVEVWNRTPARADELCGDLGGRAVEAPVQGDYDLIVNTSSAGLGGEDPFAALPLEPGGFAAGQLVVDMVYGERPSPLLAAAEAAGAGTVDGLEILVQQGALSLALWTKREPDLDAMRIAARRTATE